MRIIVARLGTWAMHKIGLGLGVVRGLTQVQAGPQDAVDRNQSRSPRPARAHNHETPAF